MRSTLLSVLFVTITASACVEMDDPELGSSSAAVLTYGAEVLAGEFDSGETTSLSSWKEVGCLSIPHDDTSAYLITGLTGFRERNGSLDNYVARLIVRCSEYDESNQRTGLHQRIELYAGAYRDESGSAYLGATQWPLGLFLWTGGGNYVKDFSLLYGAVHEDSNGQLLLGNYFVTDMTSMMLGIGAGILSGLQYKELKCPDQTVASRVRIRYDTRSGKIRRLQLYCVEVSDV